MKKVIAIFVTAAAIVGFAAHGFVTAADEPPEMAPVAAGAVVILADEPPEM